MKWTNPGHQLDELGQRYLQVKTLYLYGINPSSKTAYDCLVWLGVEKEFDVLFLEDESVLDTLPEKVFCGRPVLGIHTQLGQDMAARGPERAAVALLHFSQKDAQAAVEDAGCENIFCLWNENNRRDNFIQHFLCVWLMYKHGKLMSHWTDYNVTLRCNLNCKYCLNFNEYLENPRDVTFEEFKTHIDTMFSKFDYIYSLHLCGGEPQLARQLPEMVWYLKENYGDRIFDFFLITNGTIVPRDELLDAMKAINGHFTIDDYSDTVSTTRLDEITAKLDAAGIGYDRLKQSAWFNLDHENADNSALSDTELEAWKDGCNSFLHTFNHGRIYACCFQEYAHLAGVVGELDPENDYLDIAAASKMEILEFRQGYTKKGYVDFCKHCRGVGEHAKKVAGGVQIPRKAPGTVPDKVVKDKGLVSICVPVYNTGKYLSRCIKSLTAQSYTNLEIILVDDGSTDNSGLICDTYAALDSRIVVVHQPNGGEASARNAALRTATGEYVVFIDSDDEYLPMAVQTLVDEVISDQVGLVIGGYLERSGDAEHFATGHLKEFSAQDAARQSLTVTDTYGAGYILSTVNAKLFRGDILREQGICFDEKFVIGNDSIFICEYLKHIQFVRDAFAPLYIYYKFDPAERVQGMNWHYPDAIFLYSTVISGMIELAGKGTEEYQRFLMEKYPQMVDALISAAGDMEQNGIDMLPYLVYFLESINLWQSGAEIALQNAEKMTNTFGLPLSLISYLISQRRYSELHKLLRMLAVERNHSFAGENRVRRMIHLNGEAGQIEKEEIKSIPFLAREIDELLERIADSRRCAAGQLAEKDMRLAEKDAQLAEKDAQLAEKNTQVAEKDAQLIQRDMQLAEKNTQVAEKDAQLTQRDMQLAEKNTQVAEKDAQLTQRNMQLAEKDAQLTHRDMQLAEKDAEIGRQCARISELEVIKSSTIWRMTAPLRKLLDFLKGVFRNK